MTDRASIIKDINSLPDDVLNHVQNYIAFLKFNYNLYDNDTDYINSIPGLTKKILDSVNSPKSEFMPMEKVEF